MITRYSRKVMQDIWSDKNRFDIWLKIETLALQHMVKQGIAPASSLQAVTSKASFDTERVLEIEAQVKHDVIAFLTNVAESVGPEARYLHRGLTSSDVLDTALAVQIQQAGVLLLSGIDRCLQAIKARALEFKRTPCIGRSHGIHAEPTTFGLKLAGWYSELARGKARLLSGLQEVAVGKIAGAVGTYANLSPELELFVLSELGLKPETVATQIVARDRHAAFFSALSLVAGSLERFCTEIRHLQRTEVREVEEAFSKGQKGSSAMPHKRNPVLSENLCGLARLIRSYSLSACENVALWHERDISHSSVERVIGPDATILLDFMLQRFAGIVEGMNVYPDRMRENLDKTRGLVFSGTLLVRLVDKGVTRENAYQIVQRHALPAWEGGENLYQRVCGDAEVKAKLNTEELTEIFDLEQHFKQVDYIFARAIGSH